jgi:ABC-type transport system involved in multi-copper enzyme maturation permease subunit
MSGFSARAMLLVARQELRVRLRTGRWRWLLASWVVVVGLFTLLSDLAMRATIGNDEFHSSIGPALFTIVVMVVFGLILIVSPALTAQSINGDRERGTLAVLQVTRLRPAEIALGKLLAGWGVGVGALALTFPFALWPAVYGEVGVWRVPVVYLIMIVLLGVVCAVAQAFSALVVRGITSTMLSYATVFALTVGTLIVYALLGAAAVETYTVTLPDNQGSYEETRPAAQVWTVLAPNPFVVLLDASPPAPRTKRRLSDGNVAYVDDPLRDLQRSIRGTRQHPHVDYDEFGPPVWPYGLGADLLLGAAAVWITIRRLRAPVSTVPKGVRIA